MFPPRASNESTLQDGGVPADHLASYNGSLEATVLVDGRHDSLRSTLVASPARNTDNEATTTNYQEQELIRKVMQSRSGTR